MVSESRRISVTTRLLVAAVAMTVGVGLAEIGARVFYPRPPELGREPQLLYQSDPDLGFLHVPNQSGYLDDGLATINALGLRGSEPKVPKPTDSVRVLAIGDSTTFGWGVDDADTYPEQLQTRLQVGFPRGRPSVLNAGVVSYDLKQSARLLKRLAPALCPDIVLVGVFWNDLPYEDVSPEGEPQPRRASAPVAVAARAESASQSRPRTFRMANQPSGLDGLLRESRLMFALRHAWLAAIAPTTAASNQVRWELALLNGVETPAISEAWRELSRTLSDIRSIGDTNGFAVGVLIIPIRTQVDQPYPRAAYQTRIREMADAHGFFVIDPLEKFTSASDPKALFIPYDRMHFTGDGNALLADAAFEALHVRPEFQRVSQNPGEPR